MKNLSIRNSENLLFATLIMVVFGWSAASVAARQAAPDAPAVKVAGASAHRAG
jgi:hypothetical protein